jgi:small subunit ribosomal protein S21
MTIAKDAPQQLVSTTPVAPASNANATASPGKTIEGRPLEVSVDERGIERAIRQLKRKIATEGVTKELKRRKHYEKPSVRKRRKSREAERRRRRKERRAQMAQK